jgi:hypothetical protein
MSIRNHIPEFIDFDFVEASLRFFVYPDPALLCRSGYAKAQGGVQNRNPLAGELGAAKINLLPPKRDGVNKLFSSGIFYSV